MNKVCPHVNFNKLSHNFPPKSKMFAKVGAIRQIIVRDNNYISFIALYVVFWIFQSLCHVDLRGQVIICLAFPAGFLPGSKQDYVFPNRKVLGFSLPLPTPTSGILMLLLPQRRAVITMIPKVFGQKIFALHLVPSTCWPDSLLESPRRPLVSISLARSLDVCYISPCSAGLWFAGDLGRYCQVLQTPCL